MDDIKLITVSYGDAVYTFEPLSEGQIAAVLLAQKVSFSRMLEITSVVMAKKSHEGSWDEILTQLATEDLDPKGLTQILSDVINGGSAPADGE